MEKLKQPSFLDQVRHLLPELTPEERLEARQELMNEISEYMAVVEEIDRYNNVQLNTY